MRAFISKVVTGSMIAGAALAISACKPAAAPATDNTIVTDMGNEATDTMSDNMTATDSATMDNGSMANDTMMSNSSNTM